MYKHQQATNLVNSRGRPKILTLSPMPPNSTSPSKTLPTTSNSSSAMMFQRMSTTCFQSPVNINIHPTPKGKKTPPTHLAACGTILPVTEVDLYLWKRDHATAQDRKDTHDENMAKAYIIFIISISACPPLKTTSRPLPLLPISAAIRMSSVFSSSS